MRLRIYTDTSVFGGCEDEEFRFHSKLLVDAFARGEYKLVLSELALRELAQAPEAVRQALFQIPEEQIEPLALSPEAEDLADRYLSEGAIGARMRADALHIALATVARIDVLVSWNFKHIVNLRRIHAYNAVNLKQGYPLLEIRSPRELLGDE